MVKLLTRFDRIPYFSREDPGHEGENHMEISIETLTGNTFELRVSPFETVISVKAKIQRLEGMWFCIV